MSWINKDRGNDSSLVYLLGKVRYVELRWGIARWGKEKNQRFSEGADQHYGKVRLTSP